MVVVIEMVMLEEVDREITKKEADNVAGNISNLYSAKNYILHVCNWVIGNQRYLSVKTFLKCFFLETFPYLIKVQMWKIKLGRKSVENNYI